MYLSAEIISIAISELEKFHPFYGITFLVFKMNDLPVGNTKEISIDSLERAFMEQYYKPFENSSWYVRIFRPNNPEKKWLDSKYPGSGSQSTRTRGRIAGSLVHDTNEQLLWGWQPNYVDILSKQLRRGIKVPAFYLAVWLFRETSWPEDTQPEDIVYQFLSTFKITDSEGEKIFDLNLPSRLDEVPLFDDEPATVEALIPMIGMPPDLPGEGGGILSFLELQGVGPADRLTFEPARRLNLITGDNGLGKTFILDTSWWALTGQWIDYPADPTNRESQSASITYRVAGEYTESSPITIKYNANSFTWPSPKGDQAIPSLLVYARADNSFAIYDPVQHHAEHQQNPMLNFSPEDVWFGLEDDERRSLCEGLLRDWVTWQNTKSDEFEMLNQVLKRLSPEDTGELAPGKPTRVPHEKRLIPTLELPYGSVPVIYISEGMRRIIALAYLLVWAWSEHVTNAKLANADPQRRMVLLIDEVEAHLHPKWQRLILPALLDVQSQLSQQLEVQFLIATHSPLVMASIEPVFDPEKDKIFNLDLVQSNMFNQNVELTELPFVRYGVVDSWLTEVFELGQARSTEAEQAIEDAKQIQLEDDPTSEEVNEIHARLSKYLAADDEFWPRWLFFAETHGVQLQ